MRPNRLPLGTITRLVAGLVSALAMLAGATLVAQIPGRNVNMVAGTDWPDGDPFLQRQNEPSIAASTRNPLHLVGGSNDYRTVDVPGLPNDAETGDAWLSIYKSFDGGQRWSSTLMPGYPQDTSAAGLASPIKGYQAAADPVVRAGTNGLIYYNGLVFDRGDNGKSGIFLSRFIDRNNKENGDPIAFLGTSMVVTSTGTAFLDKPWMAVDMPRANSSMCVVGGTPNGVTNGGKVKRNGHRKRGKGHGYGNQPPPDDGLERVPGGAVYVTYSSITGEDTSLRAEIFIKRSVDCGATWSNPIRVSRNADQINQGATLSIDPQTGHVYIAWRRFGTETDPDADAIMVTRLPHGGGAVDPPGHARKFLRRGAVLRALDRIFEHRRKRAHPHQAAELSELDQGTSSFSFRTNAYPTMTIDGSRRVYIAWAERGFAQSRPDPVSGDARVLIVTTMDGKTFSAPTVVDDNSQLGHQIMPSLAFGGGKLMLVFYDLRETAAEVFSQFISDADSTNGFRHTIDIRAAMASPGASPAFAPSVRVSDYLMGYRSSTGLLEQLQINPPNLPMFKLGTAPFIGDYIDVAPAPAFVPNGAGGWSFNTQGTAEFPVFHAVWTDNRDVRAPLDGNWSNYAPPTIAGFPAGGASLFDPNQSVAVCQAGNAGSRNQNIYTARIGGGLLVGAPGNTKPLSPTVQRGFVVFAQNQTTVTKTFRMTVLGQPPGGRASFDQFPLPPYTASSPAPRITLDVRVPPRSTAARTLYATSTDSQAQLNVSVTEVSAVGGPIVSGGLTGRVLINPDIENPDIENPDIENPDIENPDIENAEVYNPDIENPDIENPDIENPDIENPDIENPDIENVVVANPDIENIGVGNPDIENPDIENPDIENPDIENPDIENGAVSDVTWTVSNVGNTTSAFNVNLLLASAGVPAGVTTQLIVYKTYKTPVVHNGCDLKVETRNVMLFNVPNPNFVTPGEGLPDQNDPSDTNATLWLSPGELGRVTLRVYDNDRSNNITFTNPDGSTALIDPVFNPTTQVIAGISGQGVDVLDPPGATEPPVVTTTGTNLVFLQQPTDVEPGAVIAPPVSVRIWSNSGAPLPSVTVTMSLLDGVPGAVLSGGTAVTDANGVATFGSLSVNLASSGVSLRATASTPGVVAAGTSVIFNVAVPPGGLVSLWHADGNVNDSQGANHGTLAGGASFGPGRIGQAFSFSNAALPDNQYVTMGDPVGLRMSNAVTIAAWIHPTSDGLATEPGPVSEGGIIVNKEDSYEVARFGDGTIRWAFANSDPGWAWIDTGAVAPLGEWSHVAVTYDAGVINTYLNGNLVHTYVGSGNITPFSLPPNNEFRIGGRYTTDRLPGYRQNFDGLIDEVGIYNTALSALQVLDLYGAAPPLVTQATVSITNWSAIYDGTPKEVTVTTNPLGLAVSVTYDFGPTIPSAIGAYYVTAVVTEPGYEGSASVVQTIASTISAGAWGGGPYGPLSCGSGVFANGFRVDPATYYGVLAGQLLCDDENHADPFGRGTPTSDLECPAGQVMVGFFGTTDASAPALGYPVVTRIGPRCQSPGGGPITEVGPLPTDTDFGGNTPFTIDCPAGRAVTGVVGGTGDVVDSIALVCGGAVIESATPSTIAAGIGQMIVLRGSDMPGTSASGILFSQSFSEISDLPASYTWTAGSTLVIARAPSALQPGPATVRSTDGFTSTPGFPITISAVPGAPVLVSLRAVLPGTSPSCDGPEITTVEPGQEVVVLADGIDTQGPDFVWIGDDYFSTSSWTYTTGPTVGEASVCAATTVPNSVPNGSLTLQITVTVNGNTSAPSNAIEVTVPFLFQ